ncbi:hypothetical protein AHAS_Ahas14G0125800 [Arachis hypogaea]
MPLLCASVLPECGLSSSICTSKLRLLLNHQGFWPLSELLPSQFGIAAAPFCYYRNPFHAKLPKSIGNMPNLEVFDADAYSIDGEIPLKIGNLTNLYTLIVYRNDLSGTILTTIKVNSFWRTGNKSCGRVHHKGDEMLKNISEGQKKRLITGELLIGNMLLRICHWDWFTA